MTVSLILSPLQSIARIRQFLDRDIFDGVFQQDVPLQVLAERFIKKAVEDKLDVQLEKLALLVGGRLDWDSNYFGFPCYRINYFRDIGAEQPQRSMEEYYAAKGAKLGVIRVPTISPINSSLSRSVRFTLCARKVVFRKEIPKPFPAHHQGQFCLTRLSETRASRTKKFESIRYGIRGKFGKNRFSRDKAFTTREVEGIYFEWLKGAIIERPDSVFTLTDQSGEDLAICAIREDRAITSEVVFLDLILTLSHGGGYGNHLLKMVERELSLNGKRVLIAIADNENVEAVRLYERNGFHKLTLLDEYHYWSQL